MGSADTLSFVSNDAPTIGVELELMLVDPATQDLAATAVEIESRTRTAGMADCVKLEITQSMIEINSSVHAGVAPLQEELHDIAPRLSSIAAGCGTRIAGGGTHPFHRWQERRISPTARFHELASRYGYLSKQFTIFGQHIHVGCGNGDDAVRAIQVLGRFIPQFIALSACSPFHRGVDTSFDSCRLNMVAAFPLSGRMPPVDRWRDFEAFYQRLVAIGVVSSLKDFYWDIRPKPAYGTLEIRVPDTPLDVETAADLAAYAQLLVVWSRTLEVPRWLDDFVYRHNRYQAARFGFEGSVIISGLGERRSVRDDILATVPHLRPLAQPYGAVESLDRVAARAEASENGARWLRRQHEDLGDLPAVVDRLCTRWTEQVATPRGTDVA